MKIVLGGLLLLVVMTPLVVFGETPLTSGTGGLINCAGPDCTFNDVVVFIDGIIDFLIRIAVSLSAVLFAYAGFLYLTSADNPNQRGQAKKVFSSVFIGFVIALSAWLLVNFVTQFFINKSPNEVFDDRSASAETQEYRTGGGGDVTVVPPQDLPPDQGSQEGSDKDPTNAADAAFVANIAFPADQGAHPTFLAEWWYLSFFTRTKKSNGTDQKDLAHVLSFSRIGSSKGLLSSRYDEKTDTFQETTNTGGSLTVSLRDEKYLRIEYANGSSTTMTLEEQAPGSDKKKSYRLVGVTPTVGSFNLTLKEHFVPTSGATKPLLWGGTGAKCTGIISVFSANDTFYYSIPDLDITGTITDSDGTVRTVTSGKAWLDHQWFNSRPTSSWQGHYWSNFHFATRGSVFGAGVHQAVGMVSQIYTDGPRYFYWVKRNANGTNECGTAGTVTVTQSGASGFPATWKIELAKASKTFLTATGATLSDNQIYTPPIGPRFIEALSSYQGTFGATSFTGSGFFETHRTTDVSEKNL